MTEYKGGECQKWKRRDEVAKADGCFHITKILLLNRSGTKPIIPFPAEIEGKIATGFAKE
ncbi:MAG: hypothetical protein H6661_04490 [Ardenticatenaceae bacterium]|nr:hypothetical protein [Ardenticatenaceae bacterium]